MIIISPWARKMRNNELHPKDYPYWDRLTSLIDDEIIQVGIEGEKRLVKEVRFNLSLDQLGKLVDECETWISVDSFFQHFCWDKGKKGIVLWGQSDPLIFGHPENINLLKGREYLREKQFWLWEQAQHNPNAFVDPETVVVELLSINKK